MTDPLGLIPNSIGPQQGLTSGARPATGPTGGPDFKDVLMKQIEQVNKLQQEAEMAKEDLVAGRRDDPAAVMIATQKADVAYKALLAVRNKLMDAYEEVKQIRV